jgi:hypothetical protein
MTLSARVINVYTAVGGLKIGRGNRGAKRKRTPEPLCPPKILHDLTCDRTTAAAVELILKERTLQ